VKPSIGFWGACQLACLALFLAINGVRAVSLIVRHKVNPITLRARKRGLQGLAELGLFANVNLWAAAVVVSGLGYNALSGTWLFGALLLDLRVTRWVGLALVVLAFVVLIPAQAALGNAWRLGIDEQNPGALVTTGIYALSRNPIYLFFDLYFAGTFLINGTPFFALSAVFTVLNLHYQILNEEKHLAQVHGSRYQAYRLRTARYWTAVRAWRLDREAQKHDPD
jgi:protein-S-isoprenylcysteine O-methyltransferase Ste14